MNCRELIIIIVLFIVPIASFGQKDKEAKKVLDAMSEKYNEMGAFQADFEYKLENQGTALSEAFNGEVTVEGDKYRLEMPNQVIISDGSTMWTYMKNANEVNVTEAQSQNGFNSPKAIMNAYKKGFKYVYVKDQLMDDESHHVIDLLPRDHNQQFHRIRLLISKNNMRLSQWVMFDRSNTEYIYDINNFNPDPSIPENFFSFNESDYPNVEVVDLR